VGGGVGGGGGVANGHNIASCTCSIPHTIMALHGLTCAFLQYCIYIIVIFDSSWYYKCGTASCIYVDFDLLNYTAIISYNVIYNSIIQYIIAV
jgi:hypothetical protein